MLKVDFFEITPIDGEWELKLMQGSNILHQCPYPTYAQAKENAAWFMKNGVMLQEIFKEENDRITKDIIDNHATDTLIESSVTKYCNEKYCGDFIINTTDAKLLSAELNVSLKQVIEINKSLREEQTRHGNTGKKNAQKGDDVLDSMIKFRIAKNDKALFVKQAQREGLKLSEWCMKHLINICK